MLRPSGHEKVREIKNQEELDAILFEGAYTQSRSLTARKPFSKPEDIRPKLYLWRTECHVGGEDLYYIATTASPHVKTCTQHDREDPTARDTYLAKT